MSRRAGPGRTPITRYLLQDKTLRHLLRLVCVGLAWAVAAAPGLAQAPNYQIDKDRFIFGQIEDEAPFRSEEKNPSEYEAYNAVLLHARQFPAAELEWHARRDVTFKDLFRNANEFRLELVYFEG